MILALFLYILISKRAIQKYFINYLAFMPNIQSVRFFNNDFLQYLNFFKNIYSHMAHL